MTYRHTYLYVRIYKSFLSYNIHTFLKKALILSASEAGKMCHIAPYSKKFPVNSSYITCSSHAGYKYIEIKGHVKFLTAVAVDIIQLIS